MIPSKSEIELKASMLRKTVLAEHFKSRRHLDKMSFTDKQKMLRSLFVGSDSKGKPYSIYLYKDDKNPNAPWLYEIYCSFDLDIDVGRLDTSNSNDTVIVAYYRKCPVTH